MHSAQYNKSFSVHPKLLRILINYMNNNIQLIAYYLPQYYEIEFNNKYWGKGHTEWTDTAKAKPLFKGHYQPHVPADLGFYNLLMPEARKAQAEMAKKYGVDGFCYWHYWFGYGETIMEKPIQAVVESGEPDFPFCLCWANHSWHNPRTKRIILEQKYYGDDDYTKYFYSLLHTFKDKRYIKIDNKPVFNIFEAESIPSANEFIELWNNLAIKEGFDGIYFIGLSQSEEQFNKIKSLNLNAINTVRLKDFLEHENPLKEYIKYKIGSSHNYSYKSALKYFVTEEEKKENIIPTIISGWDHSPRAGKKSLILTNYTPENFKKHLENTFNVLKDKKNKLCFIKAWNEWGEGNHLEPDLKWGLSFLETLKSIKDKYSKI